MPSHTTLCSFVFSTLLTSAFVPSAGNVALAAAGAPAVQMAVQSALNGLRAEGMAAGADLTLASPGALPATAPATAAPKPISALTPQLLDKMLRLVTSLGDDHAVPAKFATPLGFAVGWPVHQLAVNDADGITAHDFAVHRGSDEDLLVFRHDAINGQFYRCHRDGKIVAGINFDPKSGQVTTLALDDAQKRLDAEFAFWAANADAVQPAK
jgi:hypothetical protein